MDKSEIHFFIDEFSPAVRFKSSKEFLSGQQWFLNHLKVRSHIFNLFHSDESWFQAFCWDRAQELEVARSQVVDALNTLPREWDVRTHALKQCLTRNEINFKLATSGHEDLLSLNLILIFELLPRLTKCLWHHYVYWDLNISHVVRRAANLLGEIVNFLYRQMYLLLRWLNAEAWICRKTVIADLPLLNCFLEEFKSLAQSIEEHVVRVGRTLSFIGVMQIINIQTLQIQSL